MHVIIWAGPVQSSNLSGAKLPEGSRVVVVNQGEGGAISSTAFSRLGARVGSARALLAERGVELDRACTLTLAGFSAAHGLYEQLLRDRETFERVDVLGAFDAYYTAWNAAPKPGYRAFCERAARGRALALLTTSAHTSGAHPSGSEAAGVLTSGLGLVKVTPPPMLPPPAHATGRGGLVWLDYAARLSHVAHATKLARDAFTSTLTPYLERRTDSSAVLALLAVGLGVALMS